MIYVTHDQIEAMTLADKIVVMNAGRIEQVGTPLDLYRAPANRFVAGFIGSPRMNFLQATVGADGRPVLPGGSCAPVAIDARAGTPVTVGVRSEHLAIARDGDPAALSGLAQVVEHLGSDVFAHVQVDGVADRVIVRLAGDRMVRAGETLRFVPDPDCLHVFDEAGDRVSPRADHRSAA
jgi:ABC-type sugar transport system ATPase subunit